MLEDGLCSIHKELGEEFLCNTCAIYPRSLTQVGGIKEKSLTLSCLKQQGLFYYVKKV